MGEQVLLKSAGQMRKHTGPSADRTGITALCGGVQAVVKSRSEGPVRR